MSLIDELLEDKDEDKNIVKSFKSKENLTNQIFDEKDGEYIMRDDVRKKLLEISDNFLDSLGIEFFIHDISLTGSLANYNWSNYSDIDLHILIDFEDSKYQIELLKQFFDAKKNVWNQKHDIKLKGYDVEVYVQDISEPHTSSGVYSILNNKWVVEPKKDSPKIDERKILSKGEEYAKLIDSLIKNGKTDETLDKIDTIRKKLKEFRQSGLESGGEYSYENLTFKLLRRKGYIEKLLKLKTSITDKKLSLRQ